MDQSSDQHRANRARREALMAILKRKIPGQVGDGLHSWHLGVKGSQVQILSARPNTVKNPGKSTIFRGSCMPGVGAGAVRVHARVHARSSPNSATRPEPVMPGFECWHGGARSVTPVSIFGSSRDEPSKSPQGPALPGSFGLAAELRDIVHERDTAPPQSTVDFYAL